VNDEKYIGLDVHQATIVVAVMDSTRKLVMESILETKAATIRAGGELLPLPRKQAPELRGDQ
jgi:hypothetical protein